MEAFASSDHEDAQSRSWYIEPPLASEIRTTPCRGAERISLTLYYLRTTIVIVFG
jgi:hypothetical protein